ncbi:MAG: GNAT family N-acetyltransferase [Fulvimonas sp.]|nr:GNAT family N-acetyltransferase [Fulvimonas sp.]
MPSPPLLQFAIDDPAAPDLVPLIDQLGRRDGLSQSGHAGNTLLAELTRPGVTFLTARVDGVPIACGACAAHPGYVELKHMYVLPACRGLGLGKQLLEALEREIRKNGGDTVRLETSATEGPAIELYERAGYRRCPPFGSLRGVCMEKHLA